MPADPTAGSNLPADPATNAGPAPSSKPARDVDRTRRRAALIASAIALPITVVLAFVLTAHGSGHPHSAGSSTSPLAAVTVPAPPSPSTATANACVKVFAQLPVQLGTLAPRKTDTDSSFVAAWGNPAIVIRCGVVRPAGLGDPAAAQLLDVNSVIWQPDPQQSQTVYTTVDRSVYVEVTVPAGVDQPLPLLAPAVLALPQLCTATDAAGNTGAKLPICH
ncbi:MAG: DUF3515 domain-containing protein [Actinomycetota bacterium]|nr:DUF3515 domain-containing protein [Actinomycetota bacterium]MDQ2956590.1 DUF3515 domain-containing protein [Actinomycetota bacterium]